MSDPPASDERPGGVALIIGQEVRPGREADFAAWLNEMHASAAGAPGCLGTESQPPVGVQAEWTSTYRFDSVPHLEAWMNSASRQELVSQLGELTTGPATQQVLAGPGLEGGADQLVTVVVTHRVPAGAEDAFVAWQDEMTAAERHFEGFRGAELFKPVPGVQEEWTAVYRFDTGAHLEAWLTSPERAEVLAAGERFRDFELRTIQSSFGSWFDYGPDSSQSPNRFRTSIAVWVGLYPTVMLLTLAISELFPDARLWQTLLVGNLLSSFAMTYLTMPYYVNPLLQWWLTSGDDAPQPRTGLRAFAVSAATFLGWATFFWLVTAALWTLP